MSFHKKFPSIAAPETHGFAFDTDSWSSNAPMHTAFRMFQTYGDGLTQHSNDWAVTFEHLADYLLSLAQAMLTDDELTQRVSYNLTNRPSTDSIAFCASVVFKPLDEEHSWEKKTRYFSVSEKKISTGDAKQYDKRYERVERRHDGTPDAIYTMLIPEYASGLERLLYATAIREWLFALPDNGVRRQHMNMPAMFLKWTEDYDKARELMHALEAAQNVCESYRLRCAAQSNIDSVKRNIERRKEQAAQEKTDAA